MILTGLKNLSDLEEKGKTLFYALVGNLVFIYSHLTDSGNWSNEQSSKKIKGFKATGSKWPNLKLSAVYVTRVITSFFLRGRCYSLLSEEKIKPGWGNEFLQNNRFFFFIYTHHFILFLLSGVVLLRYMLDRLEKEIILISMFLAGTTCEQK